MTVAAGSAGGLWLSAQPALLAARLALAERFLVFGSALRHDHDLAEAALTDTHRRDPFELTHADVDGPAIAAIHRIERDRSAALERALHHALGQALEVALAR